MEAADSLGNRHRDQKTGLLILQSTSFCNVDCSYCYLPGRSAHNKMPLERLPEIFSKLYTFPSMVGHITVLWHAGEPCVLPASYYERAIELIEKTRPKWITYDYSIVTNGTLLDESWLGLLKRSDFHVGLSIDGPREIHDSRRKLRNGSGTFDKAIRGLNLLHDNGIAFYVISVLSSNHLGEWDAYADFCLQHDISSIGFNIDELEGQNRSTSFADPAVVPSYKEFLVNFLMRAARSNGRINDVREFRSAFSRMKYAAREGSPILNDQTDPFSIISVRTDGGFSTFSPELLTSAHEKYGDFVFGNLLMDSFDDIVRNEKFRSVCNDISLGVHNCARSCQYYRVCGGGAPSNKLFENGDFTSTETVYCRLNQMAVLDVVLELTESLAHELKTS